MQDQNKRLQSQTRTIKKAYVGPQGTKAVEEHKQSVQPSHPKSKPMTEGDKQEHQKYVPLTKKNIDLGV